MVVNCSQCSKHLFDADENNHIGIQAQDKGFVYKIPILFGGKEPLYFCNDSCQKTYYETNFSKETRDSAKVIVDDLKKEIPKMVKDTQKAVGDFVNKLKKHKK